MVKEPTKKQLDYIVNKFVQKGKIIWPRDIGCAKNLFSQFPVFLFWTVVPAPFQVVTLTALLSKGSQDFLKIEWAKFNLQPVEHERIIVELTPQCDMRTFPPSRPRSILDFCKSNG